MAKFFGEDLFKGKVIGRNRATKGTPFSTSMSMYICLTIYIYIYHIHMFNHI